MMWEQIPSVLSDQLRYRENDPTHDPRSGKRCELLQMC
jgi:hypothetical protein